MENPVNNFFCKENVHSITHLRDKYFVAMIHYHLIDNAAFAGERGHYGISTGSCRIQRVATPPLSLLFASIVLSI